jgi:hypothetical protein
MSNETSQKYPSWHPMAERINDMTLRDYFAAKAMQALIAAAEGDLHHHHGAYDAYAYADAMLKARDQ